MTADDAGPQTREGLVAQCDAAFARWKASDRAGATYDPMAYVEYIEATHALRRFDMPHLAAMTPPPDERPDGAEETEYPTVKPKRVVVDDEEFGECPF